MKLIFSLAVVTNKNQKVEDLLKPYIREKFNGSLVECIKAKKHFISGVLFGSFDEDYDSRLLLLKDTDNKNYLGCTSKIKNVEWHKMVELENKELKEEGIDIETKGVKLDERFGFTDAIITPDGSWHGMLPLNLITVVFFNKESQADYIKNYYTQYIKPYEENGSITILSCNI